MRIKTEVSKVLNKISSKSLFFSILIGLVPALLLFYFVYTFVLDGNYQDLAKKKVLIEQKEEEVRKGLAVELSEMNFRKEFQGVITLFEESLPKVPKETELSSVMAYLQTVAFRNNTKIISLVASNQGVKSPNADKLYEREIPMAVIGKFDDVLRFWLDVSKLDRILVIRDFSIQSAKPTVSASNRTAVISATFALLAFHSPPTNEFPQIPTNLLNNSGMRTQTATINLPTESQNGSNP